MHKYSMEIRSIGRKLLAELVESGGGRCTSEEFAAALAEATGAEFSVSETENLVDSGDLDSASKAFARFRGRFGGIREAVLADETEPAKKDKAEKPSGKRSPGRPKGSKNKNKPKEEVKAAEKGPKTGYSKNGKKLGRPPGSGKKTPADKAVPETKVETPVLQAVTVPETNLTLECASPITSTTDTVVVNAATL